MLLLHLSDGNLINHKNLTLTCELVELACLLHCRAQGRRPAVHPVLCVRGPASGAALACDVFSQENAVRMPHPVSCSEPLGGLAGGGQIPVPCLVFPLSVQRRKARGFPAGDSICDFLIGFQKALTVLRC